MIRILLMSIVLAAASGAAADPHGRVAGPFLFRSEPWVNLHHFLYHAARNSLRGDEKLRGRVRSYRQDLDVQLPAEARAAWDEALAVYAAFGDRHLIFDDGLLRIGNTVMDGPEAFPEGPDAPAAYRALRLAMPVYSEHYWPAHDAANRARIEELSGYLARYGDAMATRLAVAYGVDWPAEPILVDVTNYSGRHGAYATGDPNHIVLASRKDWYPGLLALDVLFHEAGHTKPFEDQVLPRSEAAARAAGVDEGGVWHAFLFYVPSQAARAVLPESHTPYAYLENGPLVDGRMSRAEPYIREALARSDDLGEVFNLIHQARARDAGD